jgi:2'-5' RNA ligase
MIALVPADPERWAIGDENVGESPDSLHVTLAYLGNSNDIPGEVQAELHRALKLSTESSEWYEGNVFGASIWNATGEPSLNLAIGGASIELAHERIQDIITQVAVKCAWEMPQQHLPWVAHMCLAYDDVEHLKYFIDEAVELEGSVEFDRIRFALGGVSVDYPLMWGNNLPPVNTEPLTAAATEPLPEGLPPPPSTPITPIFPASVTLDELVLIERAWRLEVKNAIIPELEAVMRKTADRVLWEVSVRAPVLWNAEQPIAQAYLTRVENQLVGVGNDMWLRTRDELIVGMQSGESIPQLSARVKDVLDTTNARATMIARTEVIGASNAGALQQVRLLPPEAQPSKKTWLATRDKRTRLEHRVADGQTVPLDGKFTVGGEKLDYPGDPDASAHERVNCRCAITWEFDDDPLTSAADPLVMFHLPGKHDQKSHSRGGKKSKSSDASTKSEKPPSGGATSGDTDQPLTVVKGKNPDRDWRAQTDPDKRAEAVWQHYYEDMQTVRAVHINVESGRESFDGVMLNQKRLTQVTKPVRGKQVYTEQDYRNDLVRSANHLGAGIKSAPATKATSFRAMRVDDPGAIFKVGSTHETGLASFDKSRDSAKVYFKSEDGVRTGKAQVALELKAGSRALPIQSSSDFESELVTSGKLRVTKITPPPKLPEINAYGWVYNEPVWVVEVEQV